MTKENSPEGQRARRATGQLLEGWGRAGVTHVGRAARGSARADAASAGAAPSSAAAASAAPAPVAAASPADHGAPRFADTLDIIGREIAGCTRCAELAAARTNTVPGAGHPRARLCFFGEAPGADEDAQGIPFVGRAGQLLTKIIEACRLTRDEVFILNVLKCRPPGNRAPLPDEVANCRGYFERQFQVIQPEFICCLGASAAQALLETTQSIGRLRGQFYDYRGARVLCTFHPSYLLRNPAAKKDVWEDMKLLMRQMGVELG